LPVGAILASCMAGGRGGTVDDVHVTANVLGASGNEFGGSSG